MRTSRWLQRRRSALCALNTHPTTAFPDDLVSYVDRYGAEYGPELAISVLGGMAGPSHVNARAHASTDAQLVDEGGAEAAVLRADAHTPSPEPHGLGLLWSPAVSASAYTQAGRQAGDCCGWTDGMSTPAGARFGSTDAGRVATESFANLRTCTHTLCHA